MRARGLVLCCIALALAGCLAGTPEIVCVVPTPPEPGVSHAPEYSREAALTAAQMIQEQGYAAFTRESEVRPVACALLAVERDVSREEVLARARRLGADLIAFLWIQRIEVGTPEASEEHREFGGFVLLDSAGTQLASSRNTLDESGGSAPSVAYVAVCEDGDPRGLPAVRRFTEWLLGSPARLGAKVEELLGDRN